MKSSACYRSEVQTYWFRARNCRARLVSFLYHYCFLHCSLIAYKIQNFNCSFYHTSPFTDYWSYCHAFPHHYSCQFMISLFFSSRREQSSSSLKYFHWMKIVQTSETTLLLPIPAVFISDVRLIPSLPIQAHSHFYRCCCLRRLFCLRSRLVICTNAWIVTDNSSINLVLFGQISFLPRHC